MKKISIILLVFALVFGTAACSESIPATQDHKAVELSEPISTIQENVTTLQNEAVQTTETVEESQTQTVKPTEEGTGFDPYKTDNVYDLSPTWFERQGGTNYGTLLTDIEYFSTTADDYKRVNILLPPGYDENSTYPVLYMIHGWGGDYTAHLYEGSYLHMLYGNMYREGITVPMIIVGVDMYTGKLSVKDKLDGYQMRAAYDKTVDDIAVDLMPFMHDNYAVAEGRKNTAVAGVSEGGAKSLCVGFQWLDQFGYIAAIAPDGNAIPMGSNYMNSCWTIPYFESAFPQPTEDTMPYYLYLAVGSEDPWNIYGTQYYSNVFADMGIEYQYDYVEGYGHDSEFWRVCMYNYIGKIFR